MEYARATVELELLGVASTEKLDNHLRKFPEEPHIFINGCLSNQILESYLDASSVPGIASINIDPFFLYSPLR